MKSILSSLLIATFLFSLSAPLQADLLEQLKELEQSYAKTEDELLQRELDYDHLLLARIEFDGIVGFFKRLLFKRRKYKNLKASLEESERGIDETYRRMVDTWKSIQDQLFEIAHAYEESGDYARAIEYYKEVKPRTSRERFRIGICYKLDGDYNLAISWFRKLDTNKDKVKFEIAESYRLWGKSKEALQSYLDVVYHYSNTELEQRALRIVEEFSYVGIESDFPELYRKLSAVYKRKAFILYADHFSRAVSSYQKSMNYIARDYAGEASRASMKLVEDAVQAVEIAERILDEQKDRAAEYYRRKLDEALDNYEYKKRKYERALRDAEYEFDRSLQRARQMRRRYEREYERYMKKGLKEQAEQARSQAERYERRISYLILNRQTIIEDDVDYEQRAMDRAYRNYKDVRNSRYEIIENYLAPYRRKLSKAKKHSEMINRLHEAAY